MADLVFKKFALKVFEPSECGLGLSYGAVGAALLVGVLIFLTIFFSLGKMDINGKAEHCRLLTPERKAPELKGKQVPSIRLFPDLFICILCRSLFNLNESTPLLVTWTIQH